MADWNNLEIKEIGEGGLELIPDRTENDDYAAGDQNNHSSLFRKLVDILYLIVGGKTQPSKSIIGIISELIGKANDSDVFHKTSTGEIASLAEKTSLADNDLFLIEDSVAGNAKKKVKKSNILDSTKMWAGSYSLTDGSTIAIDWSNGATQYVTLAGIGRTLTFSNPVEGTVYRLIIIQDGTGSRTITTWPTIKWAGDSAPILTITANKADIVTLLYANSAYYADIVKNF